jgi:hypothetical protein
MREASCEIAHELTELHRVAFLEMAELAKRNLVHFRCVGAQAPYPIKPAFGLQRGLEFDRMRAVDAVEIRLVGSGFGINGFDSLLEA